MTATIRLGVHFGPGPGKRYLVVEYPFDGTPEDFDRAFELCRVAFHERAGASVRPCGYEGPWAREQKQEATETVASVKDGWGHLDWTCYHIDGQRLVPEGEECPACGKVNRPPWSQPFTPEESEAMIAAAREIGGEVLKWAITAHYVQEALAFKVIYLERDLARLRQRYNNACRIRRGLRSQLLVGKPERARKREGEAPLHD